MKTINVLVLDDNFVIANKVKKRIFEADSIYRYNSNFQIHTHYHEIDNDNPRKAAETVNRLIADNDIKYLLLDRGFGRIIDPELDNNDNLDPKYIYKDNSVKGYYIEELLIELKSINKSQLMGIKGTIIYTYDDYRTMNKEGEIIREEIIAKIKNILPSKCYIDVLLTYTNIYKIANVNLYKAFHGEGIFELGKRDDFHLYGIFIGELLYHKLVQIINEKKLKFRKEKRNIIFYKLIILYLILISINIGGNALYYLLFEGVNKLYGFVALFFALLIPLIVLALKPEIIINIDE